MKNFKTKIHYYFCSSNLGKNASEKLHSESNFTLQFYFSFCIAAMLVTMANNSTAQSDVRTTIQLNNGWHTVANDTNQHAFDGFETAFFKEKNWKQVNVPHNWDAYEGYRRMLHGNRHGYAWYRKSFTIKMPEQGKRFFLFFEGVGSYATVWLNNKKVGYHSGGRTTFTLDVTKEIFPDGRKNLLAVRADHPANIKDQPWVCGGCSSERGFSEGSQPMGIYRPVQLIITNEIRIQPFGVHIWNDTTVSDKSAVLNIVTSVKNYTSIVKKVSVITMLLDAKGNAIFELKLNKNIAARAEMDYELQTPKIANPILWSLQNPYRYLFITIITENGKVIDKITTPYGIRWISWPVGKASSSNQFFLNNKPVFINGIAEYEHLLGSSHAFGFQQIRSRALQIKAAGFNAFRDGHQPHNLRYQNYWDSLGILCWTQLSAHVWYNTPEFRTNFKTLLREWVIERRNSPSVVLWGLQNESKLPADFAKECTELIRELDPTASSQRLVTTCNGGEGTDWNVPQNWTGTYGGNPSTYAEDIKSQILIGEYGAWRTIDLHTEGEFNQNGILSEDRMTQLMETKIRLAEQAKDSCAGQFFWLLTSHDNPGRVQGGEGFRELDRIGPVNYKGLLTSWEEPLDVFYMFRSNYAPKHKEPMAYIALHTWPDRWLTTGKKDGIVVYSNCDEVELFNDINSMSLGKRKRGGVGTHFQWDEVAINYNILYAIGYVNGKPVAKDIIILNHLPKAPHFEALYANAKNITAPKINYKYLYRVNCGGAEYKDQNGNMWQADRALTFKKDSGKKISPFKSKTINQSWGSSSWTSDFKGMPEYFASQRKTNDPIAGTKDWHMFQDFRYGRDKLKFTFPVPDGEYLVELYFIEPWLGTGGGIDCAGWRKFDVAINAKVVIKGLDIWKEAGHDKALKKSVIVQICGGELVVSFPEVAAGQAVISGLAIATYNKNIKAVPGAPLLINKPLISNTDNAIKWIASTWLYTGDKQYSNDTITYSILPPALFGAEWIHTSKYLPYNNNYKLKFKLSVTCDVYIVLDALIIKNPEWILNFEDTKTILETDESGGKKFNVFRKRFTKDDTVILGNVDEGKSMYTVAVVAASSIEPAYDLKPIIAYRPLQASISSVGILKENINGREAITFINKKEGTIEWPIVIGAADIYSLTFRYANTTGNILKARIELLAEDGTLIKSSEEIFLASNTGKWNYINSGTGTMINAGIYRIRITAMDAEGLSISALDVQ